ncbi:MAG: class I SAM-dependent methyltransferase [Planctomycetes bacterium]|nr:class I SAM-dependent methyltransferase [Planctomycetota bacterium]
MPWTSKLKQWLNAGLGLGHLQLGTTRAAERERDRLLAIERQGQFARPVLPLPPAYQHFELTPSLDEIAAHRARFGTFRSAGANGVGYSFDNSYYTSPDAEVLYTLVGKFAPRRIVEVGSGNSTRLFRQAIIDFKLDCRLISIDPEPRAEINALADECHRSRVEDLGANELFTSLAANDFLFIDSSHALTTHGDVGYLFGEILPALAAGVIVHVHDIFIPYEYPRHWVIDERYGWNEQYLVHAILMHSDRWEVLWPGYFLQQTLPGFNEAFPHQTFGNAQSLWLRRRS